MVWCGDFKNLRDAETHARDIWEYRCEIDGNVQVMVGEHEVFRISRNGTFPAEKEPTDYIYTFDNSALRRWKRLPQTANRKK